MVPLQYMQQWKGFLFYSLWSLFLAPKNSPSAIFAFLFALKGTLHSKALKLLNTTGIGVLDTWGFVRHLGVALSLVERFWQFGYSLIWGVQSVGAASSETNAHCRCFPFLFSVRLCNALITVICFRAVAPGAAARADKEPCEEGHHTAPGAITHMNNPWRPFPPTKSARGSPRVVPERQLLQYLHPRTSPVSLSRWIPSDQIMHDFILPCFAYLPFMQLPD